MSFYSDLSFDFWPKHITVFPRYVNKVLLTYTDYLVGEVIQASVTEISLLTVTVDRKNIVLVSSADPVSMRFVTDVAAVPKTTIQLTPVLLEIF